MSTTIREVVSQHLSPSYLSYGGEAISALEQREVEFKRQAAETIQERLDQIGVDSAVVEDVLVEAGLIEPTVSEVESVDGDDALRRQVAEVARQVASLAREIQQARQAAAAHGVRF